MTKVEEMWEALTAYQQQADATGHGATWLAMCEERTADAAAAALAAGHAADAAAEKLLLLLLIMLMLRTGKEIG
jgi:hypothetical protein